VRTAVHGRAGLDLIAAHGAPALILLDLMMPEMDGPTFLQHLRAQPSMSAIPIVVMTASQRAELVHLGAAALLKKPFTLEQLLSTLERWVGLQQAG